MDRTFQMFVIFGEGGDRIGEDVRARQLVIEHHNLSRDDQTKARVLFFPFGTFFSEGKSDPFVKVKEGSEGKEKFRTRTIDNTLDPVWNETAIMAMLDTNGLLLLVKRYSGLIWNWK